MDGNACDYSATELARDLVPGRLTAVEVTRASLERIAAVNPVVNAVCTPNPGALAEAEASDRRRRAGQARGLLDGVPFVAKDNLDTRGLRTTFGSRLMADNVPAEDAICVERLRRAGAVLLGKTNTPEFAHDIRTDNLLFGPTRNPADPRRTAGGSSGGTAAAVASAMAPIGLGTDLGGSIRIPAAMCGIAGLRPSPGRVPVYPTEFGWDLLVEHVHGPIARSAEDLGLMLAALAGPDERDPSSLPAAGADYAAAGRGRRTARRLLPRLRRAAAARP
jgi:amidase